MGPHGDILARWAPMTHGPAHALHCLLNNPVLTTAITNGSQDYLLGMVVPEDIPPPRKTTKERLRT